jgi:hypothetical protein
MLSHESTKVDVKSSMINNNNNNDERSLTNSKRIFSTRIKNLASIETF